MGIAHSFNANIGILIMARNNDKFDDCETQANQKHSRGFPVQINNERYHSPDRTATGRQLLSLTGVKPIDEQLLFQVLSTGKLEEVRLDEVINLGRSGVERFLQFDSSASYRVVIDGERFEWGTHFITGHKLKEMIGADPDDFALWQENRGGEDKPIANADSIDLREDGLERFFTVIEETTAGASTSFLPEKDRNYLQSHDHDYREVIENGQRGIVLHGYSIPGESLNASQADCLLLLPPGYPDVPPDMFYLSPWLQVKSGGHYPQCADQPFMFNNTRWQRWSRHSQEWRPGKDGIWTMLRRMERAMTEAA